MDITEQLYRALKRMPCSCAYKRNPEGKWMWAIPAGGGQLSRILEMKCAKCAACERYEREVLGQ